MAANLLLSTAYLPPVEYFSLIRNTGRIIIELEESYIKQTYRNRCMILASEGPIRLTVPVMKDGRKDAPVRDVTIDYSKRWQQVHLRAMASSYNSSPYFQFYFERIESCILKNHKFLIDLNSELLLVCLEMLKLERKVSFTERYEPDTDGDNDYRYRITPKINSGLYFKPYPQVFNRDGFIPGLSIADLIFNMGPESADCL